MLEREIEKHVKAHARRNGWLHYKFVSPGKRGVPDRMYFYHGHCVMIEFKSLGGRTTALQDKEMRLLRAAGIHCYVIDNVTEGKDVLDQLQARWEEEDYG